MQLNYDVSKTVQRACERTQSIADSMTDSTGNDLYELMSATDDNMWVLLQYANATWHQIIEMCMAYIEQVPAIAGDSDTETQMYSIGLLLPANWNGLCAITINNAIEEYIISGIAREWWVSRGNSDYVAIETQRQQQQRSKIKYSLNCRTKPRAGRMTRYY